MVVFEMCIVVTINVGENKHTLQDVRSEKLCLVANIVSILKALFE